MAVAAVPGLNLSGPLSASGALSARRTYPRAGSARSTRSSNGFGSSPASAEEDFRKFLNRTAPTRDELKENIFDKGATETFRKEAHYTANYISIAPPEEHLDIKLRDTRRRPLPSSLRPGALDILDGPLRCLDRSGKAPPGHPSDQLSEVAMARAPPQPVPAVTQKHENEYIASIEESLQKGDLTDALWDQYAKRAEVLLITMPLDKVLRVLKAFVQAKYRGASLYTHIGGELAKDVKSATSNQLCQVLHWIARAGLRDQTLMSLLGNEVLLRVQEDFDVDMLIEVLNAHAKLDTRNPRLISAIMRELGPLMPELSKEQCTDLEPLTVMNMLSDPVRCAYLSRCAELGMGVPVGMTKPHILRQFRLLEDCLRLDYHPTQLPVLVQVWLTNLKTEADTQDIIEPTSLSAVEEDALRILREELDIAVTPALQDGLHSLHLVMGRTTLEVLDPKDDYYHTPAMRGQKLLRAETKLRQRLLWRLGWRLQTLDVEEWRKLTDDLYKKDFLEDLLANAHRRGR